jgi:hypothetical protein
MRSSRDPRLALLAAGLLLAIGAGAALANRAPLAPEAPSEVASSHEPKEAASPEALSHATDRLGESGIVIDDATLAELAADYGVGGAVRLAAWSDASGLAIEELAAMRDGGMGWGQIAKELDLHPGIGSIMGRGGGSGPPDEPPGQAKRTPDD